MLSIFTAKKSLPAPNAHEEESMLISENGCKEKERDQQMLIWFDKCLPGCLKDKAKLSSPEL